MSNDSEMFLRSLRHLLPVEIRATPSPGEQTSFAASPTVRQALNTEAEAQAEAQTQAQNIEKLALRQTLGRVKRNAAILGENARKYRS